MKPLRYVLAFALALASHSAGATTDYRLKLTALDMDRVAAEDLAMSDKLRPMRFAIGRDVDVVPGREGAWRDLAGGASEWQLVVSTPDAKHLNLGFGRFRLPPSGELRVQSMDGKFVLGPWTHVDNPVTGQLWTQIIPGREAVVLLRVATSEKPLVDVALSRVGHGYTGFGSEAKHCKSGACNTDVACLGDADPWNENRRSVAAITVGGTDTCTGSLLNSTAGDRRLLFATATHCGISAANVASVLAYFNYESPTCRTPGSGASGTPIPRPSTTLAGQTFIASTPSPFGGGTAGPRSDWALLQLASSPNQNSFNLFWAGWDRRPPPTTCSVPPTPSSTAGLCASIHHPGVDEKRITFVEEPMIVDNIASGVGVHWRANWDPTPPILPNVPAPQPTSLPPSVTEGGSSGSPLYNADRRVVGVLSGGPSACGATGANLRDQYGGLFHAWEGGGTAQTRMRDHLDPSGSAVDFIDGIGQCNPPAAPGGATAAANGDNRIDVSWSAVPGAERYRVFRGTGACPGSGFTQVAEVTGTSYNDTTVSGGTTYSYRIAAFDDGESCQSQQGTCTSAVATGACALAPGFGGIASAASAGQAVCANNLGWGAATGNCGAGSNVRYNVYRSTTGGFTPSPANRVASCLSTTTLADAGLPFGVRQFYVVRAEDLGATGSGGACGGVEDTNVVQRDAVPAGADLNRFSDDVEGGTANWAVAGTGAGADFTVVTTQANSPTRSWFVPDPDDVSSRTLTLAAPVALPPGAPAVLEFFHRYATEATYDGGVLEYSLDGGTTWTGILGAQGTVPANANRFLSGGYNGLMSGSGAFGAVAAWHGSFNTAWIRTQVDLADFADRSVSFRFRFGSDSSVSGAGWWIDDIRVYSGTSCSSIADALFGNGFEPAAPAR
jgi:lysyl endopeptidase